MTHVNLNTATDIVRQVILSYAEGTVFELDGRPVACLIPPPMQAEDDEGWTATKNARRFYLIDREIAESLTTEEANELEMLTRQMRSHVNAVAPLPMQAARKLHQELLEKAARTQEGGSAP